MARIRAPHDDHHPDRVLVNQVHRALGVHHEVALLRDGHQTGVHVPVPRELFQRNLRVRSEDLWRWTYRSSSSKGARYHTMQFK